MMNFKVVPGNPTLFGATVTKEGVNFAFAAKGKCRLVLYKKNTLDIEAYLDFENNMKFGNVYAMEILGDCIKDYDYNFMENGLIVHDKYAKAINGRNEFGTPVSEYTCAIIQDKFDWGGDNKPQISFNNTIIYRIHVRGFTKDKSSKVKHKGTFLGIKEKIPYFKELGITMIELMPAYDFNEVICTNDKYNMPLGKPSDNHINYWGYTDGFYFAPKASYAYDSAAGGQVNEFKELVKALHAEGIEICMEFYFDNTVKKSTIIDCINYWVLNYHIDGVHITGNNDANSYLFEEELLSDIKIIGVGFPGCYDYFSNNAENRHIATCNEGFMVTARRFLKGDEDQVSQMAHHVKVNPIDTAKINYVSNHGQFTLFDTVSYERKHNDINGENNHDGPEYNYSWNWGIEGPTKKKKICELRKRQIKNALAFLLLSQGVPLIFMGDERCNTQHGNNNPYCQDNEISWINWNMNVMNREILAYTRFLIKFRKEHGILHMKDEMRQMDYLSKGLPDMSYHGTRAWTADFNHINRHFAIMYCGAYADEYENDIYIAYNMHWEDKKFGLPVADKKHKWYLAFTTADTEWDTGKPEFTLLTEQKTYMVPSRTVAVFISK
ncbi:MAG: hypothetical protein ACI4DS_05300 [Eubacterium sp.]